MPTRDSSVAAAHSTDSLLVQRLEAVRDQFLITVALLEVIANSLEHADDAPPFNHSSALNIVHDLLRAVLREIGAVVDHSASKPANVAQWLASITREAEILSTTAMSTGDQQNGEHWKRLAGLLRHAQQVNTP